MKLLYSHNFLQKKEGFILQIGNVSQGGLGQVDNIKVDHALKKDEGVKHASGEAQGLQ